MWVMDTYLDSSGENASGNQYPEMGYQILRVDM
jgi:hypothetical protein